MNLKEKSATTEMQKSYSYFDRTKMSGIYSNNILANFLLEKTGSKGSSLLWLLQNNGKIWASWLAQVKDLSYYVLDFQYVKMIM